MDQKINIVQIGCGSWGKNGLRALSKLGALYGLVDKDLEKRAALAEHHKTKELSFEQALRDDEVNAFYVASPAKDHFSHVSRALKAGKHVLVEKPICLGLDQARNLARAASKANKVLMVAHQLQYHPLFEFLYEQINKNVFGSIKYLYSNRLSLGKVRAEEDVLWSFGPHDLSMIFRLLGETPIHINAQSSFLLDQENCDAMTVQLEFRSGVKGHLYYNWLHPIKEQRLVVIGTKASAIFEDSNLNWDEKLRIHKNRIDKNLSGGFVLGEKLDVHVPYEEPLLAQFRYFLNCLLKDTKPRTDIIESIKILECLEETSASSERNAAVIIAGSKT